VLGNRLRGKRRLDLAALTTLLLRAAWCHALYITADPAPSRPEMAAAAIRMVVGYAEALLDQAKPVAKDPRAMLTAVSPFTFAYASYPAACVRIAEILGLRCDVAVMVGGEPGQFAAVGADRVPRLVRVRQVGEEVVDVAGQRVPGPQGPGSRCRLVGS
jgi:hypothetical protein